MDWVLDSFGLLVGWWWRRSQFLLLCGGNDRSKRLFASLWLWLWWLWPRDELGEDGGEVVRELDGLVEVSLAGRGNFLQVVRDGNGEEAWCILVSWSFGT